MHYAQMHDKKPGDFKRLVGVTKGTFGEMLEVLEAAKPRRGRPPTLSLPDQLLMTLMYLREYRTMAHIAVAYVVSEPTAFRTIRKVEDTLMHSGRFTLPSNKALRESPVAWVIVDTFEAAIDRPKKTAGLLQRQEAVPHPQG